MKNLLAISILFLFASCGSNKTAVNTIADEKFKLCSDIKYSRLITDIGPTEGKQIFKENIHSLFENLLLKENYLTEISKSGYSNLLKSVARNEVKPELMEKFKTELEFDPYLLFPTNSFLSCYGYLFEQLNILDKAEKETWQYQFGLAYNKFEAYGNLNTSSEYLIKALNEIPDEEFEKIMYRKLFLDLIFMELN